MFEHRLGPAVPDRVEIGIVNEAYAPTGGIGLTGHLRPTPTAPVVAVADARRGLYVTGIEPANCDLKGRAQNRSEGTLPSIAAGASQSFDLEIRAATGSALGTLFGGR